MFPVIAVFLFIFVPSLKSALVFSLFPEGGRSARVKTKQAASEPPTRDRSGPALYGGTVADDFNVYLYENDTHYSLCAVCVRVRGIERNFRMMF